MAEDKYFKVKISKFIMITGLWAKILIVGLVFLGEALYIYGQMLGAKGDYVNSQPFLSVFLKAFLIIAIAGGTVLLGYMLGMNVFKNIWIVSVISITSILLMEPILAWAFFKQIPTVGAVVGFILGAIGLFSATFF